VPRQSPTWNKYGCFCFLPNEIASLVILARNDRLTALSPKVAVFLCRVRVIPICMCITQISDGDGITDIAELLPAGSAVAVVAAGAENASEYMRKMRRAGIKPRLLVACGEQRRIPCPNIDDDVRLIAAYGGESEADCAKLLGKERKLPVYFVAATPAAITALTPQCRVWCGTALRLSEGAVPVGAAIDERACELAKDLPDAFGGICAATAGVFDSEAYLRAVGKSVSPEVREEAFNLAYRALDCAKKGRNASGLCVELARISLRLASLAQSAGLAFVRGAADDCARTAQMLFAREERAQCGRGELAFLFGCALGKTYLEFVSGESGFTPPPDNNYRAEKLCEYLGFDELTAARAAISRMKNAELAAYRVREYREELGLLACDCVKVFDEAKRLFRRMYPDDGYSLKGKIEPSDLKLCMALAPDTFAVTGSALTLMREFGLLERWLF